MGEVARFSDRDKNVYFYFCFVYVSFAGWLFVAAGLCKYVTSGLPMLERFVTKVKEERTTEIRSDNNAQLCIIYRVRIKNGWKKHVTVSPLATRFEIVPPRSFSRFINLY